MKTISKLLVLSILLFAIACKRPAKQQPPLVVNPTANVSIRFNNQISGAEIKKGEMNYTNASGNLYSVDLLKYYITNVILVKDDGTEFKLNNYDLINAFDANYATVLASNVPNGNYTSMKFLMGVDKSRNHSGAQDGDLDPANNMIWTWSTGYIFFKHEGRFKDITNANANLFFHMGTDAGLSTIQIPVSLTVAGVNKTMNIVFDLNKMYNSPIIDFNPDHDHQSIDTIDAVWLANMVTNTNDAFSFKNVE